MDPLQNRIESLSGEDRIVYRQWLRRAIVFYTSIVALLLFAAFANQMLMSTPLDVAGETMQTAAIGTQK